MRKDDINTIRAALLYIISKLNRSDAYGIVKAAYYAQENHFVKYALPIFNDKFIAMPFGPVPSLIYDSLKVARGEKPKCSRQTLNEAKQIAEGINFDGEMFSSASKADMDYLSKSAVECLDDAIERVSGKPFGVIMNDTHGAEWERASKSQNNVMDDIAIARECGASQEALDYLSEYLAISRHIS